MAILLEVACFSPQAINIATAAGAHRLELCSNYKEGGLSPDMREMKFARGATPLPLAVMSRPRGGDFVYSKQERRLLYKQAIQFAEQGADTIVFGCLKSDGTIDDDLAQAVCKAVYPIPCAFSRAFDRSENLMVSLEQLKDCDVKYIVTSGGMGSVLENMKVIKKLLAERGGKVEILIAGGIRSSNAGEILRQTKVSELHTSAIIKGELPDEEEIKKLLQQLKEYSAKRMSF